MELYNGDNLELSKDPKLRLVQEKIINGEELSIMDKMIAGRDYPVKEINGYKLKPDHCYRAINEHMLKLYEEMGYICGTGIDDEYEEYEENGHTYNNNKGIDWYLGGVDPKYGNIILECPADKEYFQLTSDNGCGMSYDPTIRHIKSSGYKNPIPLSMITNVFDINRVIEKESSKTR